MAKGMQWFDWLATILVIVGAINWGLVGLFSFNLVTAIVGTGMVANIVYDLVGAAGVIAAIRLLMPK